MAVFRGFFIGIVEYSGDWDGSCYFSVFICVFDVSRIGLGGFEEILLFFLFFRLIRYVCFFICGRLFVYVYFFVSFFCFSCICFRGFILWIVFLRMFLYFFLVMFFF